MLYSLEEMLSIFLLIFVIIIIIAYFYYSFHYQNADRTEDSENLEEESKDGKKRKSFTQKKIVSATKSKHLINKSMFAIRATENDSHQLYFNEIGGHNTEMREVGFSNNCDLLATLSSDGHLRCMSINEIGAGSQHDYNIRHLDPDAKFAFTQNSKRLLIASSTKLSYYKITWSKEERNIELMKETNIVFTKVTAIQVLDVEKWMTIAIAGESISGKPIVQILNQKGENVASLGQELPVSKMPHKREKDKRYLPKEAILKSSPDDRVFAVYGVGHAEGVGDTDIGIFEPKRNTEGYAVGVQLSLMLSGHTSPVVCFTWNDNGKRAVSLCADGTWRLWDTSARFNDQDKPRLFSGEQHLPSNLKPSLAALCRSGTVLVLALVVEHDIYFCAPANGDVLHHVPRAFGGRISRFLSNPNGSILAAVVVGAKRISLWKSPPT